MTTQFKRTSHLPASVEDTFAWHERPGAFERMLPPWEECKVVARLGTIHDGDSVRLKTKVGPVWVSLSFLHKNYIKNQQFQDVQVKGPFSSWHHTHAFEKFEEGRSKITDIVDYKLPVSSLGSLFNNVFMDDKLDKMFTYRHRTLSNDLYLHSKYSQKKLKILVTGASGLVAQELIPFLTTGGHTVVKLSRNSAQESSESVAVWDSEKGKFKTPELLQDLDAVVHLAGENIASQKWTEERKRQLTRSRVDFTKSLSLALLQLKNPPKIFVAASGIGIYGPRHAHEVLDENSSAGEGFLAELAQQWEHASDVLDNAGVRVVHLRFGAIVTSAGGILKKMLTPYKFFVGGPVGSGEQMLPWISLVDVLGLVVFSLSNANVKGPVNAVSPSIVTNSQFSDILAQALNRPSALRIPEIMIDLLFGEMGKELLLSGQNAKPQKALKLGYEFLHAHLHDALTHYLGG